MDPKIASKLLENTPEMVEFVSYLKGEVLKLDSISDFKDILTPDLTLEVLARQRAMEILVNILKPLVVQEDFGGVDKSEYTVDVP